MYVKPKQGLKLIDPATMSIVPEDGVQVPDGDQFWLRRLRDGDVTVEENPSDEQAPAQKNDEGGAE